DTCCYYACEASPGCGRPFVVAGEARLAEPRASSDWLLEGTRAGELGVDAAIGREWLRDALAEHASVAAFSAFNLSLLALGAPAELVRASTAAALDEVYHARACFELASEYSGRPVGPAPLDVRDLQIGTDLAGVVERAFLDGCIGETAAALVARASLDGCEAPRARAALERIAEDEARHAELAWQFVAWAVQHGGEAIVRVLQSALERAESTERDTDTCRASEGAPAEWRRAGRLSEAERTSINRLALRDIVRPMLGALLSRRQPPRGAEASTAREAASSRT
ncbi:MAG TPA: ferritin-like domain-containing protein, partial [Polyangiaceae bacterium]|nr:ferritin-like domain-containing protein [Polyangiaceae bacterium]